MHTVCNQPVAVRNPAHSFSATALHCGRRACACADDEPFILREGIDDAPHEHSFRTGAFCGAVRRLHLGPVALGEAFHQRCNENIARQPVASRHEQDTSVVLL